jgi:hypothetical protein
MQNSNHQIEIGAGVWHARITDDRRDRRCMLCIGLGQGEESSSIWPDEDCSIEKLNPDGSAWLLSSRVAMARLVENGYIGAEEEARNAFTPRTSNCLLLNGHYQRQILRYDTGGSV